MRYLRSIVLLSLSFLVISPPVWASESVAYKAGRLATLLDEDCGRYGLSGKLHDKFSRYTDYNKGETSVTQVGNNPSAWHDSDCSNLEITAKQLLTLENISSRGKTSQSGKFNEERSYGAIAPLASSPSAEWGRQEINSSKGKALCFLALDKNRDRWDSAEASQKHVQQAKLFGLSEEDCYQILSGEKVFRGVSESKMSAFTNISKLNQTKKQRNSKKALGGYKGSVKIDDVSSSLDLVCQLALNSSTLLWDTNPEYSVMVDEAKGHGLSEIDCARMLGLGSNIVSKSKEKAEDEVNVEAGRAAAMMQTCRNFELLGKLDNKFSKSAAYLNAKETHNLSPNRISHAKAKAFGILSMCPGWEKIAKRLLSGKNSSAVAVSLNPNPQVISQIKYKKETKINLRKNPDAIAVIIGNRDYKGSTPDVDFAGNDADAMRKYVLNKLGYRPGNVIDLRDTTKAEIEATFGTKDMHKGKLYDYVRADESDVIVFYSGHGVPGMSDRRGYLLSVDADPNRAELTGYPVDVLLKNLAKVPAKSMMVFIDACFSGQSPKGMIVNSMSGLTVKITSPKKSNDKMIVVTASRGDEAASWDNEAKHGLFTKHLLEALNGEADKHAKTGNKDGKVTLGEVKAYLDREMTYQARRRFSRDQHATVSGDLKTVLSAY